MSETLNEARARYGLPPVPGGDDIPAPPLPHRRRWKIYGLCLLSLIVLGALLAWGIYG